MDKDNVIIVGAGVSGLALALFLARQGHQVAIYDKRAAFDQTVQGRSINFTISGRGLAVLEQLGLKEATLSQSAVLKGRLLHLQKSKSVSYKYGTKKSQVLLSIRRSELINILLNAVALESNIFFYSCCELIDIDQSTLTCHFLNSVSQKTILKKADYIIGADGLFSKVRSLMLKKQMASYQQTVFDWGYKEYQFDRQDAQLLKLRTDHMHMWPQLAALLVAIPNRDNTFSVIFTAPLKDKNGKLNNFDELVKHHYQEIVYNAPSFLNQCGGNPHNYIINIKISRWHLENKLILVGDAAHATYPFYGQGMNSALEDAAFLSQTLHRTSLSRLEAFVTYEKIRQSDANVLHELSEAHLHQMTKAMVSSFRQACDMLDYQLAKLFPAKWIYEYEMVSHSTVRYTTIRDRVKKQNKKKWTTGFFIIAGVLGVMIRIKKILSRRIN